jgi:hypothetical protein
MFCLIYIVPIVAKVYKLNFLAKYPETKPAITSQIPKTIKTKLIFLFKSL